MVEHSYRTIMDSGELDLMINEQGWLDNEKQWSRVLNLCEDLHTRNILQNELSE